MVGGILRRHASRITGKRVDSYFGRQVRPVRCSLTSARKLGDWNWPEMTSSTPHIPSRTSVVIVGAGLSGLIAGRHLHDGGVDLVILDKGRGVGGRCATRRIDERRFDHGAQFFTVRSPIFAELVSNWLDVGLVREWSLGFPVQGESATRDGYSRYCAVAGMNTIPKYLAADLPVKTGTTVAEVVRSDGMWLVRTACKNVIRADSLILTAPLPQSLGLLPTEARAQVVEKCPALRDVHYEPCFSLMLSLDGPSAIPEPGALHVNGPEIAWIADNTRKFRFAGNAALTIHTTRGFAEKYIDAPVDEIAERLIAAAKGYLGSDVIGWQVHRWRYSKPLRFADVPFVSAGNPMNLLLCGDYMQPPSRMEGAILSGVSAAQEILTRC
jgi:renalase